MDVFIVEHIENKFLNFEFFLKDIENAENNANTSIIYMDFLESC
jgi:hypothetical protein